MSAHGRLEAVVEELAASKNVPGAALPLIKLLMKQLSKDTSEEDLCRILRMVQTELIPFILEGAVPALSAGVVEADATEVEEKVPQLSGSPREDST